MAQRVDGNGAPVNRGEKIRSPDEKKRAVDATLTIGRTIS